MPKVSSPHARIVNGRAHRVDASVEARVGSNITPQPNGCWLHGKHMDRYSHVMVAGKRTLTHRWVYETMVDEVPEGYHVHHTCMNKGCVNPEHLRPMTASEHSSEHHAIRAASA